MREIKSIDGVPIRFTGERWIHIVENHNDLAGYYDEIIDTIDANVKSRNIEKFTT